MKRILLATLLALDVLGCSDDNKCNTGDCGGGSGPTSTASSGGAGSTTTDGSSSSSGSTSSSTASSSSSSSGTGGSASWMLPGCTTITGTSAVTFSTDAGATLTPSSSPPLTGTKYTFGVAVLDTPNVVLADHDGTLLRSTDAGCTWSAVGPTGSPAGMLTAAPGGLAYGWVDNGPGLYRYDGAAIVPLTSPAEYIVGLGVDSKDGLHMRLVDWQGQTYDTTDGGVTFAPVGSPAPNSGLLYRAVFDPNALDHVFAGVISDGAYMTMDAGTTWKHASGFGSGNANIFNATISPVDGNVVWAEGIELGPDERHIYRATDGGLAFTSVVDDVAPVNLYNGNPLWADPVNASLLYFEFGMSFQNYGTDLYSYDATTGMVTTHHHPQHGLRALAFSPVDPQLLYLGITHENIQ